MKAALICIAIVGFGGRGHFGRPRLFRFRPAYRYQVTPSCEKKTADVPTSPTVAPHDDATDVPSPPVPDPRDEVAESASVGSNYGKPGFFTRVVDGRLWVLKEGSDAANEFRASGEPAKSVTIVGAGPEGMTIRSSDTEVVAEYLVAKRGFFTQIVDGRLWVFEENSEALNEFKANGEPEKSATLIGEGPMGMTVKSADQSVIDKYMATP